jgi:hypothetical protein
MVDWKKAYTTFYFYAIAAFGAVIVAVEHLSSSGVDIPAWALPVLSAVGVFLRALPQEPKA